MPGLLPSADAGAYQVEETDDEKLCL